MNHQFNIPTDPAGIFKLWQDWIEQSTEMLSGKGMLGSEQFQASAERVREHIRSFYKGGFPTNREAFKGVVDEALGENLSKGFENLMAPGEFMESLTNLVTNSNQYFQALVPDETPDMNDLFDPRWWMKQSARNLQTSTEFFAKSLKQDTE